MKVIHGCEGKTISQVYWNGVFDETTILFTDGTKVSFNSITDKWTVELINDDDLLNQ